MRHESVRAITRNRSIALRCPFPPMADRSQFEHIGLDKRRTHKPDDREFRICVICTGVIVPRSAVSKWNSKLDETDRWMYSSRPAGGLCNSHYGMGTDSGLKITGRGHCGARRRRGADQ